LNFPGDVTNEARDGSEKKFAFVHCGWRGSKTAVLQDWYGTKNRAEMMLQNVQKGIGQVHGQEQPGAQNEILTEGQDLAERTKLA
jgi:copper oxidase (laccase) domain-containing protein